jgi:hypothetical protein
VLESDVAPPRLQRLGAHRVRHLRRELMDGDQIVELVDRPLEIAHLHAHVAEIAIDDEIGGEHGDEIVEAGSATLREGEHDGEQAPKQRQDQQRLQRARIEAPPPCTPRAVAPVPGNAVHVRT